MFSGHSLSQQRADNDPQDGSPGRTREGCSGLHGFPVDTSATAQAQRCKPRKAIHSAPPPRAGFRKANHLDPLEIDRDNRDNRDKSRKPLQRKAFRFSIMPNEPGHSRDKPGHSFAGRVTASHLSGFRPQKSALATRRPGLPGCRKSFPICPRRCAGRDRPAAAGILRSAAVVRGSGYSCGSP